MAANDIRLEDAITLVTSQAASHGVRLTRTKLVKLLYFVDLRAWEQLGQTVTGVEWIWHRYGPSSSSIVEACDRMTGTDEIRVSAGENFYGSPEYLIKAGQSRYFTEPTTELVAIVRSVLHDFGQFSPAQIGDLSYDTEPMRRLVTAGRRGDPIEFDHEPPTAADVRRVVNRYGALVRGMRRADEGDVAAGLHDELDALETARRSAGNRLLPE